MRVSATFARSQSAARINGRLRTGMKHAIHGSMTEKRKPGRPNEHLSEAALMVRMSRALLDRAKAAARRIGLTSSEWWRQAGQRQIDDQERKP